MTNKKQEIEIPSRGNLAYLSLPRLLTALTAEKRTGVLTIANKKEIKSIYLKNGNAIYASSNQDKDRLGEVLINTGKITPEQLDNSLKTIIKTGKSLEAVLVKLDYITAKDLFLEIRSHAKLIISSLFSWEKGDFIFKEISPPDGIISVNLNLKQLIREGLLIKGVKKKKETDLIIQKVNEMYENIDTLNYYDILKIDIKASSSEIKQAFLKSVQIYHPDKYRNLPDSTIKSKLTILFTFLNNAYKTLSDETAKSKYDNILLKKTIIRDPDSTIISVEEQFRRGTDEMKKGNFWGASEFFRWATRKNPDKAEYWAYLSLALSKMPKRNKEAEETITKAVALEPQNAKYYIHLGTVYLHAGLKQRAEQQFKKALDWDPENKTAMKELDKLQGKK